MDPRVRQIPSSLPANYHRPFRVRDLARSVNLSESRLTHLFQRDAGVSVMKFLKTVRLERARQLLEATFCSVKEIMFQVGFNDPSHFVREFEETFGLTPNNYRKRYRQLTLSDVTPVMANKQQEPPITSRTRFRRI